MMDELNILSAPSQSQITIDSVAKECPSEGFNYPTFRLLNKKSRVYVSEDLNPDPSLSYRLFAVANTRGWFVAVRSQRSGSGLVFSSLEDLRSTFADAKPDNNEADYTPKRLLSIPTKANLVAFSSDESQLFVGLEDGSVVVYDSASVLAPGTDDVQPSNRIQLQSTPLRQLVPNPGTEPGLKDLVAVVGNDYVRLLNTRLESQGGWTTNGSMQTAVAVDWSPKGKHIAIGMQSGDILTFSLTNKATPHKHIPPTFNSSLVSLNWLGPTHTFRTSYAATPDGPPAQHIIVLDTKSSTATYFAPDHPFPSFDRHTQFAYVLNLPKWDVDASSTVNQSLVVVGDISSVDLEVLGSIGNQWYRQSQENPLSLPLDKSMDDTKLLSLEVDLTDRSSSAPIMYAYLNDGSVQAWHIDHSKPYLPILENNASGIKTASSEMSMESSETKNDSDMGMSTQPLTGTVFGQSSFGQSTPSPFGAQTTSAFGQSSFAQSSTKTSSFGQTSFGQASSFSSSSGGNAFGQSNQSNNSTSAFGSVKPAAGFGAFGGSTSAFGSSAFGSNTSSSSGGAFSNLLSSSSHNAFGQPSFIVSGSNNDDSRDAPSSPTMTREASMSDSTPGFGGLSSLGGAHPTGNAVNSMFGSFGQSQNDTASKETTSAFGGSLVKPATGFGAFGALNNNSPFANNKLAPTTVSAFAPSNQPQQPTTTTSGFGQSGFATSAFGKPSFGQPSFGQSSFGATPASSTPSPVVSSGFGAFANKTVTLGGGEKPASSEAASSPTTGGAFGAFANKPVTLAGTDQQSTFAVSPPASTTQDDVENKPQTTSAFGSTSGAFSSFKPAAGFGAFGSQETPKDSPFFKKPVDTPTVLAFGAFSSAPKTPANASASPAFGSPSALGSSKSAFSPQTPSTPTAPAQASSSAAFGAFSTASTGFSPFFGTKPSFSDLLKKGDAKDSEAAKSTVSDKAKDDSEEGELKEERPRTSVFGTPMTPKASGATQQDSPTGDKPRTSVFGTPTATPKAEAPASAFSSATPTKESVTSEKPRTSVFGTPKSVFAPVAKPEEQPPTDEQNALNKSTGTGSDNNSQTNVSASSSFVEVEAEREGSDNEEDVQQSEEDGDHSDVDSFLSENFEESSYKDGDSINDDDSEQEELPVVPEEEEEEEVEEETNAGESSSKVPASRSPSATPQPELPSIEVSPSPDVDDDGSSKPAPVREPSTTPPTTPVKEPKAPSTGTAPVSSPVTSPFGLGLGRPSTKPTRSSPLANAVLPGDEEEEKLETPSKPALPLLSPKPVLAKLPLEEQIKEEETSIKTKAKRPKTPPLLSQMGPPLVKPVLTPASSSDASSSKSSTPPSFFGLGGQPTAAASTPSLFGKPLEVPASSKPELKRATTAPPASATTSPSVFGSMPPFSISNATTTPLPSGPSSLFGVPKPPGIPPPGASLGKGPAIPPAFPSGGLFGSKPLAAAAPMPSLFGTPSSAPSQMGGPSGSIPSPPQTKVEPPASPRPSPQRILEEGMQKECAFVVHSMQVEFYDLLKASQEARKECAEIIKSGGGSRFKKDLGDPKIWGLEDLPQFKQVVLQFEDDLQELVSWEDKQKQMLRDLKNSMLKAGTRKEEIVRFTKAKDDKEFAKMLKTRTLGPEYTETQTALRKNIRAIRDRVQKLEFSLQESKKKLAQATTMKPAFKAPSLDTINRTYRNIELTIDQQSEEVARLASRVKQLRMVDQISSPSTRDARLPDSGPHRRLVEYTPNIAETTAAALNAERSAQRLKKALLAVRKAPLLNKKATVAPLPPTAFDTPQKTSKLGAFAFETPIAGSLFGDPDPAMSTSEFSLPNWDLPPDDNFNPSTPLASDRRGAPTHRKHLASQPLKRSTTGHGSPVAATSTAPTGFDWGPLPNFATPPPASRLPAAFIPFSSPSPTK